jgi:hypothetical protein
MAFYISEPKLLFETTEISTHPNLTQQESNYIYLYTTKFGTSIKIRSMFNSLVNVINVTITSELLLFGKIELDNDKT